MKNYIFAEIKNSKLMINSQENTPSKRMRKTKRYRGNQILENPDLSNKTKILKNNSKYFQSSIKEFLNNELSSPIQIVTDTRILKNYESIYINTPSREIKRWFKSR